MEDCIWLEIPRYGVLVAVSLIEPGTLVSVKEAEMLGTAKTSQNPKKTRSKLGGKAKGGC